MALIVDFPSLSTAIAEWLWRSTDAAVATRVPDFIAMFEADFVLDPDMRTLEMQALSTTTITSAITALPSDYIEMERLQVLGVNGAQNTVLDYVSPAIAANLDANASANNSGTARNYTVVAGQIVITPQVNAQIGSTLELLYYQMPALTVIAPTNWLITKYPNIYLYGSLMQAAAYIDDKDTVAQWDAALSRAMSRLDKSEQKRKTTSGPLSMSPSTSFRT